jgi:hypothetical protein
MKTIACAMLMFTLVAEAKMRAFPQRGWTKPTCTSIDGPPGLRFVAEPGLMRKSADNMGLQGITAIAAAPATNLLYTFLEDGIYESRDAGCSWTLRATAPPPPDPSTDFVRAILPADERIYVLSDQRLLRLTGGVLEVFPNAPEHILELAVDPADSLHLRGISFSAEVFDSFNGGASWQKIGKAPVVPFVTAEVSPKNLDRLYASDYDHVYRSDDGGRTWTKLDFDDRTWEIESSPLDENIVWFRSTDVAENISYLYGSNDGGRSFALSLPEQTNLRFDGIMAAHVREANVLAIGSSFGPIIVTLDGIITRMQHEPVVALAWSPAGTLYYSSTSRIRTE